MGPLKVLHVAETAQGGVGSYIEEVARLQSAAYGADNVRVIMPAQHAAYFRLLEKSQLHTYDGEGIARWRSMLRMTALALRLIKLWRPDIVHLHSTYAGFALRPLLRLRRQSVGVVYCAHGWAFDRMGVSKANGPIAVVERVWSRWCDAVVCVSRHDMESALHAGIDGGRVIVVMNGIADVEAVTSNIEARKSWPEGGLRVLFVGRLDEQKGYDVFFEAMRLMNGEANAVVVGSPVVAKDRQIRTPDNVTVTGWLPRDQLLAYYNAASVVVMPSRWEGLPIAALEAMRAGRAIVATRVGGLPEAIEDGVTGRLFDQDANASTSLANILANISPGQLEAMGIAGRERYERLFGSERVGNELDSLYRNILGRR